MSRMTVNAASPCPMHCSSYDPDLRERYRMPMPRAYGCMGCVEQLHQEALGKLPLAFSPMAAIIVSSLRP
jgi:hypothetical protein